MRLLDSLGAPVGAPIDGTQTVLLLPSGPATVSVRPSGFIDDGNLLYDSPDCSGTPYLHQQQFGLAPLAVVRSNVAYIATGAPPVVHAWQSIGQGADPCVPWGFASPAYPAMSFDLGTLGFVPPFRLAVP